MSQQCLVELYHASHMVSLLNNLILVSFKAAWTLYFPWYTIYHWSKPRHLSTYKSLSLDFSIIRLFYHCCNFLLALEIVTPTIPSLWRFIVVVHCQK